jgi:hypothetical protein
VSVQRVDELTEPPVEGQAYLVPVLTAVWLEQFGEWPLLGPPHNDGDLTLIDATHWHVDPRFLPLDFTFSADVDPEPLYIETPKVSADHPWLALIEQPPKIVHLPIPEWKPRTCVRPHVEFTWPWSPQRGFVQCVRQTFAGAQCQRGSGGWICPHKGTPLGSIMPVDGVIVCPQHGLRIDAHSGRVLDVAA